jgi:putative oxidoreductase
MAVAAFHVHWPYGFLWINRGYEYPLFWGLVALAILIEGGGALSVDRRIGKEI